VLTFNIHKGLDFTSSKHILPSIKELLSEIDADIIFLQEVQGEHAINKEQFEDWPEISPIEFLAEGRWEHYFYGQNKTYEHGHHGNAILSKYPLEFFENVDISTHEISNRGLLYSKILLKPDFPLHLICTHLGLLKRERIAQFQLLNQFINERLPRDESLILAGDFNDWRVASPKLLDKSSGLIEVFAESHGKHAKTFPAVFPTLKVDRIYYRGLCCENNEVIRTKKLSDHCPLMAEFSIP
jgi:endonuclease/exonuclease/phosphatase family metal-dependent hydrolase